MSKREFELMTVLSESVTATTTISAAFSFTYLFMSKARTVPSSEDDTITFPACVKLTPVTAAEC